ncbi:MAG TPA: VOC family protein [Polyangiaceae bacterium]|nr:VOC family protein [Polyangiaceae bacterium]
MALAIDHVTISASQLERSLAHYAALLELLGFIRQSDEIWTDGAGFFIQLVEARPGTRPYERHAPGLNHLGFGAPDVAFVERVRDEMRARGFEAPDVQHIGGATCLFIKDPDGLRFEISHYPPGVPVVS